MVHIACAAINLKLLRMWRNERNIDKAINYLKMYKLENEMEYLVMANREIKKEAEQRKKAKDTAISKAK